MKVSNILSGALASLACVSGAFAQSTSYQWTEPNTKIVFYRTDWPTGSTTGGFSWGYVLPTSATTTDATEYVGYISGALQTGGLGWSGISHGGSMPSGLLLMAWPYNNQILTSFRYSDGYVYPDLYTGSVKLTQIYSSVNTTHYTLVYRCQGCWAWNQNGETGSSSTSSGFQLLGFAQSYTSVDQPSNPNSTFIQHDTQNLWGETPASAVQASYSAWATLKVGGATTTVGSTTATTTSKATTTTGSVKTTTTSVSSTVTTTSTPSTTSSPVTGTPPPSTTYDYIVVGGGAGGIVIADKLSESGKSVLLIERGPPSSYRWGGRIAPTWLQATNATRFDVPGLDNEIWVDSAGIACADISTMAGCVLGGGTAVNAGLWHKPPAIDWDYNFPTGWKSTDTAAAVSRVFSRIPGTYTPSMDGKLYIPNGYNLIGGAALNAGWANVTENSVPDSKNRTFTHPPFMYSNGERGGPLATYLVTASARKNFKLIMNTDVTKVIRTAGHITGVQVNAYAAGGYTGVINVTATTGRVILSAGTFGSPRILFRSGIGPSDQLAIVANSTDGPTMINSTSYINLPVGNNLDDHTNTDMVIQHPSIQFYDFYAAYNTPNTTDANLYLTKRSGILAQSAPNIGPLMFESIYGADGITRQLQWTARCEGPSAAQNNYSVTLSQYLGRGATSRGRATITPSLTMQPSTLPYLQNQNDINAVVQGIKNMQAILNKVAGLTWISPTAGQDAAAFVAAQPIVASKRTANHWIGTNKLGTDDGRSGGTSVIDVNTKVYGTDNLFVVDASIFPGMMTANPSAMIVSAAEHASEKILALANITPVAKYGQCGGNSYSGTSLCAAGSTCTYSNSYYSQCL